MGAFIFCAVAEVTTLVEWGRSYWTGDELAIRLPYRLVRLASARGQLFCLAISNSPVRASIHLRAFHSEPGMFWNRAEVWGPTTTSFQFGSYSRAGQAMFEYATGQWMNMLTEDKPTPMRYVAIQFPHWVAALLFGIPLSIPLLRRLRKLRNRPAFEVVQQNQSGSA